MNVMLDELAYDFAAICLAAWILTGELIAIQYIVARTGSATLPHCEDAHRHERPISRGRRCGPAAARITVHLL
jgi:hypothetical protein